MTTTNILTIIGVALCLIVIYLDIFKNPNK